MDESPEKLSQRLLRPQTYIQDQSYSSTFDTPYYQLNFQPLKEIFYPINIPVEQRMHILKKSGCLPFILDNLHVNHETGLNTEQIADQRRIGYGANRQTKSASRYLLEYIWKQLENPIILLLLSLEITISFVEYYDLGMLEHIPNIILLLMIAGGRCMMRRKRLQAMNECTQYQQNKLVFVKRNNKKIKIEHEKLLVGDILLFEKRKCTITIEDRILVDGIILKNTTKQNQRIVVDESYTITHREDVQKDIGWNNCIKADPFAFAGTTISQGCGELLVCTVGEQCTFRKIKTHKHFQEERMKFCEALVSSTNAVRSISKLVLTMMGFLLFSKLGYNVDALEWMTIVANLQNVNFVFALMLLIDEYYVIDYMCNFTENNMSNRYYRIVNKQIIIEIMNVDIIFIDESALDIEQRLNSRCYQYKIMQRKILKELEQFVHIKILASKSYDLCLDLNMERVYNADKPIQDDNLEIFDFRQALYISNENIYDLIVPIFETFQILDYKKIAVVPISFHTIYQKHLVISTQNSEMEIKNHAWLQIKETNCEEGLRKLFLTSSIFYLLFYTYLNLLLNNLIIIAYWCIWSLYFKLQLNPIYVLVLSLIEHNTIYRINETILNCSNHKIEPLFRLKKNILLFNILTAFLHGVAFPLISEQMNIFIYLLCNMQLRKLYFLRNGYYERDFNKFKLEHKLCLAILIVHTLLEFIFNHQFQIILIISILCVAFVHFMLGELDRLILLKKKSYEGND